MNLPKILSIRRLQQALHHSLQGLKTAWQHEAAFRQECLLAIIFIPLACWVSEDTLERILLISSILLVLIIELINSAIEATIDRISEQYHPLSKQAKDLSSAAVLVALLCFAMTWLFIISKRFF